MENFIMRISRFFAFSVSVAALLILQSRARADSYNVDAVHSTGVFRIHHFNSGYIWGLIAGPTGSFEYDASDPTKVSFNVSVSLDNLDTHNDRRDADLKGPDWFNAKQFPTIDFKSTSV